MSKLRRIVQVLRRVLDVLRIRPLRFFSIEHRPSQGEALTPRVAQAEDALERLALDAWESFYVGGTTHEVEGAFGRETRVRGAMYVQRIAPAQRRCPLPVVFIHGGMHTGVTWETTPDGREGWQTLFVRGGFETLVIDQAWRGRSAPDLSGLDPAVTAQQEAGPVFTCGFRLGEQFERGGGRFPLDRLREHSAQLWPDFGVPSALALGTPGLSDPRALPPLLELVDQVGRLVLVTHSQGGDLGWKAARERPDQIAAIVAVEPAVTSPGLEDPAFPDIPVYVMWGDNLPELGALSLEAVARARSIAARRPRVILDLLPEGGITGNGHMMMMEDNNAELAERAMRWLHSLALSK